MQTHPYFQYDTVSMLLYIRESADFMQGFVLSVAGALRICQLPHRTRLDTQWPMQKHAQPGAVLQVAFHPPSQLAVLLLSREVSCASLTA